MILGLTGSIGSGKSTVTKAFEDLGAVVFRADDLAREVVAPGGPAYSEISSHFGPAIAPPGGPLDRKALAQRVFSNPHDRKILESIVHPRVRARELELIRLHSGEPLVVLEIPLLYEAGAEDICDRVCVVHCDDAVRAERLERDRGMTRDEVAARLAAQMPEDEKRRRAHFEIDNSGPIEATRAQVERLHKQLTATA